MSDALYDRCKSVFEELFYNELHSETGSYIYTEKFMRSHAFEFNNRYVGCEQWINDDIIDRYVSLYKKVFQ